MLHRQVGEVSSHGTRLPARDSVCGMDRGFVHTAQGMFCHESPFDHTTEHFTARIHLQGPPAPAHAASPAVTPGWTC